ncbi:MAG: fumarate hydratase [Coriobacteriales bacterium]|nr:fumarate hydratase [Coriobacteriales bacterium]
MAELVEEAIGYLATHLRPDVHDALAAARCDACGARECFVFDQLLANAAVAADDHTPLCQDTGSVWVCLEVGREELIPGDIFDQVDDAVARAYERTALRKSILADALVGRSNTKTNTPAFCELELRPGTGATLHVMLKGGGSDNASQVVMLPPGAGFEGIEEAVIERVRHKASCACPPLVLGLGVGSTFDRVGHLAKKALLRPVGQSSDDPRVAELEKRLLSRINQLGIGPAGLGGACTALSVAIETAPCHIAALPLAIQMGCSAMRSVSIDLATTSGLSRKGSSLEDRSAKTPSAAPALASNRSDSPRTHDAVDRFRVPSLSEEGILRLHLPVSRDELMTLHAGDAVLLSGPVYTMRDAGHMRALAELQATGRLPFDLQGQTLFYAGPTPAAAGRPVGAVGPTTASRMDFATPQLLEAGIVACIGKGERSQRVRDACVATGSVYFAAVGGAASFLAQHVSSATPVAWEDLGTEALVRMELKDFPAFVAIDTRGMDLYQEVTA